MEKSPKISVVMPTYNAETYLREAIDSILNQTFTDFEFLIIDDNSNDKTREIIKSYKDKRIRLIDGPGKGISAALNVGLKEAKGEYIARMDADDISLPERFEAQVKFMDEHPEVGICGTKIHTLEKNNNQWFTHIHSNVQLLDLFEDTPFCHPTVMIRKQILDNNNLKYDESSLCAEDQLLWYQILKVTNGYNLEKIYLYYRVHDHNKSIITNNNGIKIVYNLRKQILREILPTYKPVDEIDINRLPSSVVETIRKFSNIESHIPIVIVAASDIIKIATTAMLSILKNTNSYIDFYILENDELQIPPTIIKKIEGIHNQHPNFSIKYIKVDGSMFSSFKLPVHSYITKATYFRYLIPNLLPHINKVIYLDYDIVVNKDIKDLYDIDLEDNIIGAVSNDENDYNQECLASCLKKLNLKRPRDYFNAGVLLWDLDKSRKMDIVNQLFKLTEERGWEFENADQDVLNIIFQDSFKKLGHEYNMYPYNYKGLDLPYIFHFVIYKPWKTSFKYDEYFWHYAKMSPFYKDIKKIKQKNLITAKQVKKKNYKRTTVKLFSFLPICSKITKETSQTFKVLGISVFTVKKYTNGMTYKYYLLGIPILKVSRK